MRNKFYSGLCMLWFALLSSNFVQAQQQKVCASRLTAVSVFMNQAQVQREGKVNLDEGLNVLVFEKISPFLLEGSIEVNASEGVEIVAVGTQNDYMAATEKPQAILLLEDSLQTLMEHLAEIKADKDALEWQKELLLANKSIGGSNQGVKAEELEDVLAIYQHKFQDFKVEHIRLNRLEKLYTEEKEKVEQQLSEYQEGSLAMTNQIVLQVRSSKALPDAHIVVKYLVSGVSWKPFYDIRVKDTQLPMQFVLKANIMQSTGENWANVKMKLTTADPLNGGLKPVLNPVHLSFIQLQTRDAMRAKSNFKVPGRPAMAYQDNEMAGTAEAYSAPTQSMLNLEFEVPGLSNIPSDNKFHLVELNKFNVAAIYGHASVPKLSSDVFVTAKVQTNDLISQLSGEANIYLNGTYTGKTYLSAQADDTLTITLGKDRRVIVKREKVKEMCSKSLFGSNKKDASTIELTLTNSSNEAIELIVEDQIPLSSNQDILVKLVDQGTATYVAETGILTWKITLAPKQNTKLRFSFEVSYPSQQHISPY